MKKCITLVIFLCAVFTSCKEPYYDKQDFSKPVHPKITFKCSATAGGGETKTWYTSDVIGVFCEQSGQVNDPLNCTASSEGMDVATFTSDKYMEKSNPQYEFFIYYPYDAKNHSTLLECSVPTKISQPSQSSDHLVSYNLLLANTTVDTGTYEGSVDVSLLPVMKVYDMSFCSTLYAGWSLDKVVLKAAGTTLSGDFTYDLSSLSYNFTREVDSVQVNIANAEFGSSDLHVFILCKPEYGFTTNAEMMLTMTKGEEAILLSGTGLIAETSSVQIDGFEKKDITEDSIDLSDPAKTGHHETANCYIAGKYGQPYKFPATVMGNGYTTPADPSYSPSVTGSAPGITPSTLSPDNVKILWQTSKGLINSVKLKNGYVYFTVNGSSPADFVPGNAVIAAYKGEYIIWSWHIWVTDADIEGNLQTWKVNPAWDTYSNYKDPVLMDRNLGALSAVSFSESGTNDNKGLQYQWGRKDPFVGPDNSSETSRVAVQTYDNEGNAIPAMSKATSFSADAKWSYIEKKLSRNDIARYPMMFISGASNYFWMEEVAHDLWGCPGYPDNSNNIGHKTIYDPCPPGYRVMNAYAMTGIIASKTGGSWASQSYHYALNYDTYRTGGADLQVYYDCESKIASLPAGGLVYFEKAASYFPFDRVGTYGYYWSNKMTSDAANRAYRMHYDWGNYQSMEKSYASYGHNVRCEKVK